MIILKDCEFEELCPICELQDKGDAVLIGVSGTQQGNDIEAKLVHLNCLNLMYDEEYKLIYQKV